MCIKHYNNFLCCYKSHGVYILTMFLLLLEKVPLFNMKKVYSIQTYIGLVNTDVEINYICQVYLSQAQHIKTWFVRGVIFN